MSAEFERRLARHYDDLSAQLRAAGDYVSANPVDSASRPLRLLAQEAGTGAASFSRLARELGYDSFDALRDSLRDQLGGQRLSFASRADAMGSDAGFPERHLTASLSNLARLRDGLDADRLDRVTTRLCDSERVWLLGAMGATGIVEYLGYLAHFCAENWHLVGRHGKSLGGALADIGSRDTLLVVTKKPFSNKAVQACAQARKSGAFVVVITDSHQCPPLRQADEYFIVPSESPHFYSSYVATLALVEILIGLVIGRLGQTARDRIARVEQSNVILGEVQDG